MSERTLTSIRRDLLRWYKKQRRDLPWRRTRDPYAIWVAETMLQQTRVNTVVPYYKRFLKAFPTLAALGRAPTAKVLALWSGLGYYRRAENMQEAARLIIRDHQGIIPANFGALRALPGIGPYTAGALMSIAFSRRYPAIDGNARRVMNRLFDITRDKDVGDIAARWVPSSKPGRFNEALMELGATICGPREPLCPRCPVAPSCRTQAGKRPAAAEIESRRRKRVSVTWPVAVIQRNGKILLRRRPGSGILPGLWELPGGEGPPEETPKAILKRYLNGLDRRLNSGAPIGEIRHSITYRKIRCPVFKFNFRITTQSALFDPNWRWFSPSSLHRHPVSTMTRKAIKLVVRHEKDFL